MSQRNPGVPLRLLERDFMKSNAFWQWTKSSALSWPIHVAIVVLAFILRAWDVGNPKALVFDEAYYVRQAYSMISHGVEMRINPDLGDKSIEMWNGGNVDVFTNTGAFVVHPPLGKWLIAVGQMVGGVQNPWSWRIAAVLAELRGQSIEEIVHQTTLNARTALPGI